MIEHRVIQYSDAWWELRLGIPTASCFDRIITPTGKPSGGQQRYIDELIAELVSPRPKFFTERQGHTVAMRNGINNEPEARRYFELQKSLKVRPGGFITTDDGRLGSWPDFMVDVVDDPGELKCCEPKTHVGYLREAVLPRIYKPQVHGHLVVTGKQRCWFESYSAGFDPLIVEVVPDSFTMALRVQLELFDAKLQEAKKNFKVGEKEQQVDTPEAISKAREWTDFLAELEGEVHDGIIDEQVAMNMVNARLPELKKMELPVKRKVYGVLKAWIDVRPVKWHL